MFNNVIIIDFIHLGTIWIFILPIYTRTPRALHSRACAFVLNFFNLKKVEKMLHVVLRAFRICIKNFLKKNLEKLNKGELICLATLVKIEEVVAF